MRVLLVDDQQLVRRGFALLLGTVADIEVVAQAADGTEALAVLTRLDPPPDAVLTDARMPGMDGIELTRRIRRDLPQIPVLVLTTFDDEELVRGAIAAGAGGFLLKDTSVESLADALRAVTTGGLVLDPRVARHAFSSSRADRPDPLAVLTRMERQVAELVAQGRTNTEIAAELVLAEGTVKNHVSALLRKLNQRDRTALALTLHRALDQQD